jgi:PAS domain S-box-containing protein
MTAPPRILIVEDERIAAEDVKMRLESWGFQVEGIVSSGEEAVEKALELSPDLVLMDIQLQGAIDGIDAARIIRERSRIPVVFATAAADRRTLDRAQQAAPYGFVAKPFDEREMRVTLDRAVMRLRLEREYQDRLTYSMRILESIADGVIVSDEDCRVRYMNPAAAALLGTKPEQVLGTDLLSTVRLAAAEQEHTVVFSSAGLLELAAETSLRLSGVLLRGGSHEIPVSLRASRLTDSSYRQKGFVLVLRENASPERF